MAKEAQSLLLSFDKVRGQAFERTLKVATDLSARLGTDLKSSIRQVGLALQDPVAGLTLLRRSGIAFDESQKNLIKTLHESGRSLEAQNIILAELERRFSGSAEAARNTLGGALTGLKNALSELFEGTRESTSGLVNLINDFSAALSNPKVKQSIDEIIAAFSALLTVVGKVVGEVLKLSVKIEELSKQKGFLGDLIKAAQFGFNPISGGIKLGLDALGGGDDRRTRGPGAGARQSSGLLVDETRPAISALEEVRTTARRIAEDVPDSLRQMNERTRTEFEQTSAELHQFRQELEALLSEGLISKEQFNARLGEQIDETLLIDIDAIRSLYKGVQVQTSELGEFMKGVWQGVGRSIQATLSDALYEWRLSWRSLLDIARRALADITSAIITSGIKNALQSQFKTSSSSGSSTGGWLAALGSLFGLAGGGRFDGARIVGEDGPELVTGRGRVFNQRQMAFAGVGGAQITYAPQIMFKVETKDEDGMRREVAEFVETRLAQDRAEFTRQLQRSGVEVKG